MNCKNCGAQLNHHNNSCPVCQKSGKSPTVKKNRQKIQFFTLGVLTILLIATWLYNYGDDFEEVVHKQLAALSSNQLTEAYYNYTSKDFQEVTPLDSFHAFMECYPVLVNHKGHVFNERALGENTGTLKGYLLTASNDISPIQYKLVKENKKWKINNIDLRIAENEDSPQKVKEQNSSEPALSDTEAGAIALKSFLESLRETDIANSYGKTSDEFQKNTSLEQFQIFLNQYPIVNKYKSYVIDKISFEDGTITYDITLDPDKGAFPMKINFRKENGGWKLWNLSIRLTDQEENLNRPNEYRILEAYVVEQLKSLQTNEISKTYDKYFSDQFKKSENLEKFKTDFIKKYPLLSNPQAQYETKVLSLENNLAQVSISISMEKDTLSLVYLLEKNNGLWKIRGVKVVNDESFKPSEKADKISEDVDQNVLIKVIENQLQALSNNDFTAAYTKYTAKNFQSSIPLQQFKNFVELHPIFAKRKSFTFTALNFNNNIAVLTGTLTSLDDRQYPVEFKLVNEDGDWKILYIDIYPPLQDKEKSKIDHFEILKIVLGNSVDATGIVLDPGVPLKSDSNIYANVYVQNGIAGTVLSFKLQHLETHFTARADSTSIRKNGDSIISVMFEPPLYGWPKGDFQLRIDSSTGLNQLFSFKIE